MERRLHNPMTWDGPGYGVGSTFVIVFCRAGATYLLGSAARAVCPFQTRTKLMRASVYQRAERA